MREVVALPDKQKPTLISFWGMLILDFVSPPAILLFTPSESSLHWTYLDYHLQPCQWHYHSWWPTPSTCKVWKKHCYWSRVHNILNKPIRKDKLKRIKQIGEFLQCSHTGKRDQEVQWILHMHPPPPLLRWDECANEGPKLCNTKDSVKVWPHPPPIHH